MEELDHRTNAVKKVGQDLYRLREKNAENEVLEYFNNLGYNSWIEKKAGW